MRTGRLSTSLLSLCALVCLLSRDAVAQGNFRKDPNTVAIPAGLNSTISLTHALIAIDDKSPMATSVFAGQNLGGLVYGVLSYNPSFAKEYETFKEFVATLAPAQQGGLVQLLGLKPGPQIADDANALTTIFSNPTLLPPANPSVQEFFQTPGAVRPDTLAILNLRPLHRGILLLNRLLLRDYVAYLGKQVKIQFPDPSGITPEERTLLAQDFPPDVVATTYYGGIQVRSGGGPTVYTPEMIYSNGLGGFDVAAQAYLSELNGYAASFRFDVSPGRTAMVHAVSTLQSALSKGKQAPEYLAYSIVENNPEDAFISAQSEANRRIVQMQLAMRSSLQFSYRHVDNAGSFSSVGLSVSKLFQVTPGSADKATPASPYNGITFLFNAQALQSDPTAGSGASTIRTGVAVYWQDRVSRLLPGPPGKQIGDIRRWSVQSGVEYNFRNSLQPNDAYGIFLRERIGNFTEFTVSAGRGADKKGFLGFSFGKTFF